MKLKLDSTIHGRIGRVMVFLTIVTIVAGMAACGPTEYNLIVSSTAGGSVTEPGEGKYTYREGIVVILRAEAEQGYRFVNWTGSVAQIDDVDAAMTTITMNGHYAAIANFEAIPVAKYNLTISSTAGGSVTTPGEGVFTYDQRVVVSLVATPDAGYRFVTWSGDVDTVVDVQDPASTITMHDHYSITAEFGIVPLVAAGLYYTVGVRGDGTVVAAGPPPGSYFDSGQCDVGGWTDIVQVTAGERHTVGLAENGTVVAVGWNGWGQCDVGGWTGIVQVAAGGAHTVGLRSDGRVVAVGYNEYDQCDVEGWRDIVQVAAGGRHTVGLKSDGTVVAVGWNGLGQCDVGGWTGIVQVAAGHGHTVGLQFDRTVITVGLDNYGQCNTGDWTDIIQVATGGHHTLGLKPHGTVVAAGRNDKGQCDVAGWSDIVQVAGGGFHTVGIKSDGTVLAVGDNAEGQCNVEGWNLL